MIGEQYMQAPAVSTDPIQAQDEEITNDSREEKCADCPGLQDNECPAPSAVALSEFRPGEKGRVRQVCGNPDFRRRLMEMGFVRGTEVSVIKYAPLNDPMELVLMGYHVSLRKGEAAEILMDAPDQAA
jgi:ferrous iron transport protein A